MEQEALATSWDVELNEGEEDNVNNDVDNRIELTESKNIELENFRAQWQKELKQV